MCNIEELGKDVGTRLRLPSVLIFETPSYLFFLNVQRNDAPYYFHVLLGFIDVGVALKAQKKLKFEEQEAANEGDQYMNILLLST